MMVVQLLQVTLFKSDKVTTKPIPLSCLIATVTTLLLSHKYSAKFQSRFLRKYPLAYFGETKFGLRSQQSISTVSLCNRVKVKAL